jgi:hypothetical protein
MDYSSFFIPDQMHKAMKNTFLLLFPDKRSFLQWKQLVARLKNLSHQEKAQQSTWLPRDSANLVVFCWQIIFVKHKLKVNINEVQYDLLEYQTPLIRKN